jgi:hypothetical protein
MNTTGPGRSDLNIEKATRRWLVQWLAQGVDHRLRKVLAGFNPA